MTNINTGDEKKNTIKDNGSYKFECKFCNYACKTKFLYKQHCSTKKHKKNTANILKNEDIQHVCLCGKKYNHIQSYKRHIQSCNKEMVEKHNPSNEIDNELRNAITNLISQNQNILLENKEMREIVKEMIPKIGNTVIHNKFNLQIFLNEKCKDAINLTEFVQNLSLNLDDLNKTRRDGYVSGITNIFVKGLRELELHKRPIHCCDLKREVLYVRDNNEWGKESNNKEHIKDAINIVAKKQIGLIKLWETHNPDWSKTDKGAEEYIKMIRYITDAGVHNNSDDKIIRTIAKEVLIKK
tara:strand:- start:6854 stop:7744 length:891 start_codon:yes stop_codon:yes gene_type:complete